MIIIEIGHRKSSMHSIELPSQAIIFISVLPCAGVLLELVVVVASKSSSLTENW